MWKQSLKIIDLLKPSASDIFLDKKYLVVDTISDGFTGTVQGGYSYLVTKTGEEYAVNELIYDVDKDTFNPSDEPIIVTDGDQIFFVTRTLKDPYNYPVISAEKLRANDKKEAQVLQAFLAFAEDRFKLANYNVFIADEPCVLTVLDNEPPTGDSGGDKKEEGTEEGTENKEA